MDKVLVDTSVIVRYLKTADGILADIIGHYSLFISAITVTELLATSRASDVESHRKIEKFLDENFKVLNVTREVAGLSGDIVRQLEITLANALVAATAIKEDVPLLSYEIKTFDRVPDLKLIEVD